MFLYEFGVSSLCLMEISVKMWPFNYVVVFLYTHRFSKCEVNFFKVSVEQNGSVEEHKVLGCA